MVTYTTILDNRLSIEVPKYVAPTATDAGYPTSQLPQLLSAVRGKTWTSLPGVTADIIVAVTTALRNAQTASYKTVYLASIAFGAIALAACFATIDPKQHLTLKVAKKLHGKDIDQIEKKEVAVRTEGTHSA